MKINTYIRLIKWLICGAVCILGTGVNFIDAVTSTASFMEVGYYPESQGLGMTGVSHQKGSSSVYWNTGRLGMPDDKSRELSTMYYRAFETDFVGVEGLLFLKKMPIGFSYRQAVISGFLGSGINQDTGRVDLTGESTDYKGRGLIVGTGVSLTKKVGIGLGLKYIEEDADVANATGFGADMGVYFNAHERVKLGMNLQNMIQPTMTWNTDSKAEETVPLRARLGSSTYWLNHKLGLHNEVVLENGKSPYGNWGVGYDFHKYMDINVGLNQENISIGLDLKIAPMEVGFSWTKPKREYVTDYYKFGVKMSL